MGASKVMEHLMFGLIVITAEQLFQMLKILQRSKSFAIGSAV